MSSNKATIAEALDLLQHSDPQELADELSILEGENQENEGKIIAAQGRIRRRNQLTAALRELAKAAAKDAAATPSHEAA